LIRPRVVNSMTVSSQNVPHHIALVMDGNGRWASKRFLPRIAGHRQGVESLKRLVKASVQRGIKVLTVFAFSSENWSRPADEVSGLMDILAMALSREVSQLQRDGVRLHFVGSREGLSERVSRGLDEAELATRTNSTLTLNVCFNYGGRWDIVQAAAALAKAGEVITEQTLSAALSTALSGDPDLIIRTGGEYRLSNFLLWQAAYAEMHFSDLLWPDFDEAALDAALIDYVSRERRFGMTSAQVATHAASPT
jgi:undecaprenyl diphosphate synthase